MINLTKDLTLEQEQRLSEYADMLLALRSLRQLLKLNYRQIEIQAEIDRLIQKKEALRQELLSKYPDEGEAGQEADVTAYNVTPDHPQYYTQILE